MPSRLCGGGGASPPRPGRVPRLRLGSSLDPGLRALRGRPFVRAFLGVVVLDVDDPPLRVEREGSLVLSVRAAALAPAAAAPATVAPEAPASTTALAFLLLLAAGRASTAAASAASAATATTAVASALRISRVARLGAVRSGRLHGFVRCGGTLSFSVHP